MDDLVDVVLRDKKSLEQVSAFKRAAKVVTASNDEDGVAKALEDLL